jgi:hypothetical protein
MLPFPAASLLLENTVLDRNKITLKIIFFGGSQRISIKS